MRKRMTEGNMAHKRKDTFVPCQEWWKHLRPYNKRVQAKAERKAAKERVRKEAA